MADSKCSPNKDHDDNDDNNNSNNSSSEYLPNSNPVSGTVLTTLFFILFVYLRLYRVFVAAPRLLSRCGVWAPHCDDSSRGGTQALICRPGRCGAWAYSLHDMWDFPGSDWTDASCIGRQTFYHWAIREVPPSTSNVRWNNWSAYIRMQWTSSQAHLGVKPSFTGCYQFDGTALFLSLYTSFL